MVYSGYHNERLKDAVLAMGAAKLVSKSAPIEDLIQATKDVVQGPVPPVTAPDSLLYARLRDLI